MDKKELIRAVKKQKIKPSELFDRFDLREDPAAKEMISQEVEFELEYRDMQANEELNKEIEEDKLKENNNELIPGSEDKPSEEEKKRRKEIADNELIPDDDYKGEPGDDNDLIPD